MRLIALAAIAMLVAACHEIPQDAAKPFASKEDTQLYAGETFKGDKQKFEATLATRTNTQNEYLRTGDAKP